MTVYVDDSGIQATVGRHASRWSHLFADDRHELHAFARRLGLRRAWFQDPVVNGKPKAQPGSFHAETWHYDVTSAIRDKAIELGAQPVTSQEALDIMRARHHRLNGDTTTPSEGNQG